MLESLSTPKCSHYFFKTSCTGSPKEEPEDTYTVWGKYSETYRDEYCHSVQNTSLGGSFLIPYCPTPKASGPTPDDDRNTKMYNTLKKKHTISGAMRSVTALKVPTASAAIVKMVKSNPELLQLPDSGIGHIRESRPHYKTLNLQFRDYRHSLSIRCQRGIEVRDMDAYPNRTLYHWRCALVFTKTHEPQASHDRHTNPPVTSSALVTRLPARYSKR